MASSAAIASIVGGAALAVFATRLGTIDKLRELGEGLAAYPPFLMTAGGVLVAGGVLAAALRKRVAATARIALIAAANVAALQIMLAGTHVFDAYFSAEQAIDTFVGEQRVLSAGTAVLQRRACWTRACRSTSGVR